MVRVGRSLGDKAFTFPEYSAGKVLREGNHKLAFVVYAAGNEFGKIRF